MWRNTDIKYPDGGETQSSFYIDNVPSYTQVQKLITTGVWDEAQTNLDGFGRPDKTANLSDPNGDDYRDITYDALGRLASVSNPYYTTGDPTYGVTDYSYDALGRTTKITNPDSTSKTFAYAGSATKSTDESGIEKVTQTDGLGRVVYVCDGVGAGTQANGAPPSPCSLPFSPTGFLSTYGYDPLGNLTLATVGAYTGFSGQTRSYSYDELSRITSETNPESGITTYTYDTGTAGDMATRVRPKANQSSSTVYTTTSYTFDALHRLTSKAYDDGTPTAHYAYDQTSAFGFSSLAKTLGRMSSAYAASGSTTLAAEVFSYDTVGRVLDNSQCFTTGCSASTTFRPMPYAYNLLGEVTSSAYINGITFSYGYDNVGRMTSVTSSANDGNHPPSLLSNTTYNALGELTAAESGTVTGSSGFSQVWNYDTRGRTTYYRSAINGGPTIQIQSGITYWGNGDVLGFSDGILGYTWGYGYDAFNRLQSTTQTGAPQNVSYTYTYDQFGNRWHQNLVSGTGSNTLLSFDAYNHISGYSYDAAGNLLNDTVHTYTYDAEGRLSTVDTSAATYTYDALGKRVMSVTGGHTYYFGYNQGSAVAWELQDTTAYRGEIYGGMGKIATYKAGLTFFPTQDLVGTVRNNVTQDGGASESCVSLPFGDGQSCFGNAPGQPGPGFFTGQDRDTESNLDHFQFRQYNSTDGRWMVPDPAGMAAVNPGNPQTWNRYAYVINNPLNFTDPLGLDLDECDPVFGFGCDDGGGGNSGCTADASVENCDGSDPFGPAPPPLPPIIVNVPPGSGGGNSNNGTHGPWANNETSGLPQLPTSPLGAADLLNFLPTSGCVLGSGNSFQQPDPTEVEEACELAWAALLRGIAVLGTLYEELKPSKGFPTIDDLEKNCKAGRFITEPSTSRPGWTSTEQEYICPGGVVYTVHCLVSPTGASRQCHVRPGPPKAGGGD
jgi:RHS repeat-associated protein